MSGSVQSGSTCCRLPSRKVRVGEVGGLQGQPAACQCGAQQGGGLVGAEVAADADRRLLRTTTERPHAFAEVGIGQAAMRRQIGRRLRHALAGQVRGRGHQHGTAWRQHPADERGVRLSADADGQVDARLHQVERAFAGVEVDLELRMQLQKVDHRGRHLRVGKGHAAGDAQLPAQVRRPGCWFRPRRLPSAPTSAGCGAGSVRRHRSA